VSWKAEHEQKTGSFKVRGAFTKIQSLTPAEQQQGVIAHSSGNHGQAVAYVASRMGIKAVVVVPESAPPIKVAAIRDYGAEVIFCADGTDAREAKTNELLQAHGYHLVPPYDDWAIITGQGTVGLEMLAQAPNTDVIVIPVGGGGLLAGIALVAKALNPAIRVYGVETEGADDAYQSFQKGERVKIAPPTTIADGIRTQVLGEKTWPILQTYVDGILVVSEAEVIATLQFLITRLKVWVEPTAAVAAAALYFQKVPQQTNQQVMSILCGGNADLTMLQGLSAESRIQ
jgi:threo-3-hydroxy-L-aspartate ammonia-lyase